MAEIIFYDERCPLCNVVVRWIMRADKDDLFQFAPLSAAEKYFPELSDEMDLDKKSTVYLLRSDGKLLAKSDVVIHCSRRLGGLAKAGMLLAVLPKPVRDWGYSLVARYRFKLSGKPLHCDLPPVDKRHKFVQFDENPTSQNPGSA